MTGSVIFECRSFWQVFQAKLSLMEVVFQNVFDHLCMSASNTESARLDFLELYYKHCGQEGEPQLDKPDADKLRCMLSFMVGVTQGHHLDKNKKGKRTYSER